MQSFIILKIVKSYYNKAFLVLFFVNNQFCTKVMQEYVFCFWIKMASGLSADTQSGSGTDTSIFLLSYHRLQLFVLNKVNKILFKTVSIKDYLLVNKNLNKNLKNILSS